MELTAKAAALAAAFAILAALTACASSDERASRATATGVLPRASVHTTAMENLAGLRPADVASILGPPDLRRDEPPAELWQYRAADCVLNLFFYSEAGGYRLARAEAWQRTLSGGSVPAPCHDEDAPVKARLITRSSL